MRRVNTNQEGIEALEQANLTAGAVRALASILGQMQLDDHLDEPDIADRWRSPYYRGHLAHAIEILAREVGASIEAVQEHLEQPPA
jgi:hypothetical protein